MLGQNIHFSEKPQTQSLFFISIISPFVRFFCIAIQQELCKLVMYRAGWLSWGNQNLNPLKIQKLISALNRTKPLPNPLLIRDGSGLVTCLTCDPKPSLYIVVICIIYCNRYCYDNSIYWIDIVIHYKILFVYNLRYWGFSLIRFQVHGTDLFTFFIFLLSVICCGVLFGMHDQGVFQSLILSEYLQDHDIWT